MPNTTNLSLPFPQASDSVDVPRDISALAQALDTKVAKISLSSAPPASPVEGLLWYQTDTDLLVLYNGAAWVEIASALTKAPRGALALTKNTTLLQSGVTTVVDLTGMTATFTAVASRNYKVSFGMYAVPTVTNACFQVNLQNGATVLQTTITNGGVGGVGTTMAGFFVSTFTAGSITLKLTGSLAPSSTGTITFNAAATLPVYIIIEDVASV